MTQERKSMKGRMPNQHRLNFSPSRDMELKGRLNMEKNSVDGTPVLRC